MTDQLVVIILLTKSSNIIKDEKSNIAVMFCLSYEGSQKQSPEKGDSI